MQERKLSQHEIEHIAHLARIDLSPEEKERFSQQLSSVLEYMQILNKINTEEVPSTTQVTGLTNIFRKDEVFPCDSDTRKRIVDNFPKRQRDFLEVPAIFSQRKS